jgi:L-threonylcarbamoyladenylate synthase
MMLHSEKMDFAEDLKRSLEVLRTGGIILYPTDTIWGLGCDATDETSVEKIYAVKQRPAMKSMIILVDSFAMLERYTSGVPPVAFELIEVSDGPITLVLPAAKGILAPSILSPDGFVGVRLCHDEFCSSLIGRFRKPIVSTSANISGTASPAIFPEISEEIISGADYTVQYRQNDARRATPSPVIKIDTNSKIEILRK